ncbi:MAG: methylornithine synthase PylB [Deferrisomatales bacterium]
MKTVSGTQNRAGRAFPSTAPRNPEPRAGEPEAARRRVEEILRATREGAPLSREDAVALLSLEHPETIRRVMEAARALRERHFGKRVFLYGFIYLSTHCRNHCSFCFYRRTNPASPRYRKQPDDVVAIARELVDSGVHLIDLTLGEDPLSHDRGDFSPLSEAVRGVKAATGVPVMVSPGVVPPAVVGRLAEAGADWYAIYQETHSRRLFRELRIGQDFDERARTRAEALRAGLLIEDGILLGVGESAADRADSAMAMRREGIHQARAMGFVPQVGTPLEHLPRPSRLQEALAVAVLRLAMPDRLIPASLDIDGIRGLELRLEAGANVVTSIIPPSRHLAGVSQSSLDIEQGLRTVPQVRRVLESLGLACADVEEYRAWVKVQRGRLGALPGGDRDSAPGTADPPAAPPFPAPGEPDRVPLSE